MQQSDVRIGALNDFAVELEHQPQHAVGRRVLRPEVHRVVPDLGHLTGTQMHFGASADYSESA